MKLELKDQRGNPISERELRFELIEDNSKTQPVHDVVVAYMAAQRAGTHSTKTRAEVAASGKKPWRQKGTGRARVGSVASPIWRGGGVVFGPKPRDYSKKVNKKTRQIALRKALSERIKGGDVILVDSLSIASPKTKEVVSLLNQLEIDSAVLIVTDASDSNLALGARNLSYARLATGRLVTVYDLLMMDKIVMTDGALAQIEERLRSK